MPKTKVKNRNPSKCWKCERCHFPPMGAKCTRPRAEAEQIPHDNMYQTQDDPEENISASGSEIDTGKKLFKFAPAGTHF
jgi:hypothetical protein